MSDLKKEIFRKLIHLTQLAILAGYTFITFSVSKRVGLLSLTVLLLILLEFEYFRIEYRLKITKEISEFFEKFILRKKERDNVVGAFFYVSAAIIALSVFDYSVALNALLLTAFGDFTSALTGMAFGKKKIFRNKTYVGTLCGFVVNILVGYLLLPQFPMVYIPMAFVASTVETLTQKLDDNLTVPLFAGFAGQSIVFIFGLELPRIFGLV